METKKTLPLVLMGLSLIQCIYFLLPHIPYNNDKLYFGFTPYINSLLIATIAILICSLLLSYLVLYKLDKSENILIRIIQKTYLAIILSIATKTICYIFGYSWQDLGVILFPINTTMRNYPWSSIVWNSLLLIIFFFILCLKKNIPRAIYRGIAAIGLSTSLILSYRVAVIYKSAHLPITENKIDYIINDDHLRKVIWIVFDEFDPEIAFDKANITGLPNFKSLLSNSVYQPLSMPPANMTLVSIPSMLMGIPTKKATTTATSKRLITTHENNEVYFEYKNTIFSKIKTLGLNSSILGFYHPYCDIFRELKCKTYPMEINYHWYSGIVDIYSLHRLAQKILPVYDSSMDHMAYITHESISKLPSFIDDKSTDLVFIHLNIPHLPGTYAEHLMKQRISSKNIKSNEYMMNLMLSDEVLKVTLDHSMNLNKKVLLIASSDHWLRTRQNLKDKQAHPSLFIAKISDDNTPITIHSTSSNIYIEQLLYNFLTNKISTHYEIKDFMKKQELHETIFN